MGITAIHHNKQYWEDPEKFIPERFDSESKFYLTPDGKKRPPFTYNPYLEGKRICAGKKLAETISTFVILSILGKFEIEFEDKTMMTNKPLWHESALKEPVVMVKVKRQVLY